MGINLRNEDMTSTLYEAGEKIGTRYLVTNDKHYEIQRTNNFMFSVRFPAGFFDADDQFTHEHAKASSEEVLRISVSSAFIPHFQTNAIEVKRGNATMKFAGVPTFSNGTIKFDDFIGAGTKDLLMAWQRKVYNVETEKVGLASDYKLPGFLVEYTPDYQVVRTWNLDGCWISALNEDDYSHESNDKHGINCTVEYDRAYIAYKD